MKVKATETQRTQRNMNFVLSLCVLRIFVVDV